MLINKVLQGLSLDQGEIVSANPMPFTPRINLIRVMFKYTNRLRDMFAHNVLCWVELYQLTLTSMSVLLCM